MATVTLEHVDKVYPGGTRALTDVNLEVGNGELLVLVGPSGCGKSTVLRLVAGLEEATGGRVLIGGRLVNGLRPQERNVAMVFQDYALYPHLSARENLEFPLRMRRLDRGARKESVERVAGLLDIAALLDRLPRELSGGQRQRVAMGRALVREPAVFLLDEPLSNLDARLRIQVRAEIKTLQQRTRTTMLYVTHDQVEAMTLGDRVVVLDKGRLQQVAPPRVLYDHPANAFVAGFIGSPPMNLVPARATADAAIVPLGGREVRVPLPARSRGRPATAGMRPEHLRLIDDPAGDGAVPAAVEHVEYLGHETLAHLRVEIAGAADPAPLVVRVPGMPALAPDTRVGVVVDPARVHLFDDQGRTLAPPPADG